MANQPQLVNRQFNSPIGLYSEENVRELLARESQMLSNGAMGIDFHIPTKTSNLQNSAVLRMLEEEEFRQRKEYGKGFRSDGKPPPIWPPPEVNNRQLRFRDVVISGVKRVAWPPPRDTDDDTNEQQEAPQAQVGSHTTSPRTIQTNRSEGQVLNQQQQQQPARPWTPIPSVQHQDHHQPLRSPAISNKPQNQYEAPSKNFEPPPATITLRPTVPISQAPAPIVTSQPATATFKGGKNLRGDLKWPPENVRSRMEQEHQHLIDLERGPACRPRRVAKDYSHFFAQHALNSTYPGYKIPPGTQFYDHHPVW